MFPFLAELTFDATFLASSVALAFFTLKFVLALMELRSKLSPSKAVMVKAEPELVTRKELENMKKAFEDDMTKLENDLKDIKTNIHTNHISTLREINSTAGDIHTRLNEFVMTWAHEQVSKPQRKA